MYCLDFAKSFDDDDDLILLWTKLCLVIRWSQSTTFFEIPAFYVVIEIIIEIHWSSPIVEIHWSSPIVVVVNELQTMNADYD